MTCSILPAFECYLLRHCFMSWLLQLSVLCHVNWQLSKATEAQKHRNQLHESFTNFLNVSVIPVIFWRSSQFFQTYVSAYAAPCQLLSITERYLQRHCFMFWLLQLFVLCHWWNTSYYNNMTVLLVLLYLILLIISLLWFPYGHTNSSWCGSHLWHTFLFAQDACEFLFPCFLHYIWMFWHFISTVWLLHVMKWIVANDLIFSVFVIKQHINIVSSFLMWKLFCQRYSKVWRPA